MAEVQPIAPKNGCYGMSANSSFLEYACSSGFCRVIQTLKRRSGEMVPC
jgi:hypothetical protein